MDLQNLYSQLHVGHLCCVDVSATKLSHVDVNDKEVLTNVGLLDLVDPIVASFLEIIVDKVFVSFPPFIPFMTWLTKMPGHKSTKRLLTGGF